MARFVAVSALLAALLFTSSASAATRFVDDDRRQCPQAAHTTINAAIAAAAAGDLVQVCAGRYAEQVVLPAGKPGLFLNSPATRAARIVAPAAGLVAHTPVDQGQKRLSLVRIDGARQHFEGFSVEGPLRPRVADEGCASSAAVDIEGDDVIVADVGITGLTDSPCVAMYPEPNIGIRISGAATPSTAAAWRARRSAWQWPTRPPRSSRLNTIVGRGSGSETTGLSGSLVDHEQGYAGAAGTFRSNEVSASGTGVSLLYWDGLVLSNNLHDNGTGLIFDDGSSPEIRSNAIRHNALDGLVGASVPRFGLGKTGLIRSNQVRDNGRDGIAIFGCAWFVCGGPGATSHVRLDRNTALGNGRWDCFDDGIGDDTWTSNVGVKDSPNVCAKP